MARRRGSSAGAILIAIVVAILHAAPAAAASPWVSFSQSGASAVADSSDCTDNVDGTVTCSFESIFVFEGVIRASGERRTQGEQVCYSRSTDTFDPESGEPGSSEGVFGCTSDAGTVTVDDLDSVVLEPTLIQLTAYECDASECTEAPGGSTTVSGTWAGLGPIVSQKSRSTFDDGICVQVNADRGSSREASFEGSFDAQFAQISSGRFTFRTSCQFEGP